MAGALPGCMPSHKPKEWSHHAILLFLYPVQLAAAPGSAYVSKWNSTRPNRWIVYQKIKNFHILTSYPIASIEILGDSVIGSDCFSCDFYACWYKYYRSFCTETKAYCILIIYLQFCFSKEK